MQTLCFNEIFKNYDEFKEYTDELALYDDSDTFAESLNQMIYYLLYNHYLGCSIAYNTEDEFCAEFGIAYQQYFKQFKMKQENLQRVYNLTAEDLEIVSEALSNFTSNPNDITNAPFELLNYTTNQTRGRTRAGKLQAYLNALQIAPDAQLNDLIKKFDYLWLDILDGDDIYLF